METTVSSAMLKKRKLFLLSRKIEVRFLVIPSCLLLLFSILAVEQHHKSTWRQQEAHDNFLSTPFVVRTGYRRLHERSYGTGAYDSEFSTSLRIGQKRSHVSTKEQRNVQCSCVDDFSSIYCCQRAIIGVYNMGLSVVDELRYQLRLKDVAAPEIMAEHRFGRLFEAAFVSPPMDYRHVVVTRNWYDAIVSGYIHHKSGRDCWLDSFGNPGHKGWLLNNTRENWEQRLLNKTQPWWPPGNGRDLCTYLAVESEEVGLRVFTAWAMSSFMLPLSNFRRLRQEVEVTKGWKRTKFLCYENVLALNSSSSTELYLWYFPNRTRQIELSAPRFQAGRDVGFDPLLRKRLQELVSQIDTIFYNGTIANGSREFGCRDQESLVGKSLLSSLS